MAAIKIHRVALPKGALPKCEICGEPAEYRCSKCPTHYCTILHFDVDWKGVLHLIYEDLSALAEKRPILRTEKDREKKKQESAALQSKILTVSAATAKTWVIKGEYQLAVAGALYALKMSEQLFGHEAVEAVPAYLLLAEIYLGITAADDTVRLSYTFVCYTKSLYGFGCAMPLIVELQQLQSADDLLTLASWSLLKNTNTHDELRPQLYRNFGRLYSAQNRCEEALKACALDVYHSAETYGPNAFEAALSYYYMARAFEKSEKPMRCAFRFYEHVCNIYLQWFDDTEREGVPPVTAPRASLVRDNPGTGDIKIQEAIRITREIQERSESELGAQHKVSNLALLANSVLLACVKSYEESISQLKHASARFREDFGSCQPLTSRCQAYLKAVEKKKQRSP